MDDLLTVGSMDTSTSLGMSLRSASSRFCLETGRGRDAARGLPCCKVQS